MNNQNSINAQKQKYPQSRASEPQVKSPSKNFPKNNSFTIIQQKFLTQQTENINSFLNEITTYYEQAQDAMLQQQKQAKELEKKEMQIKFQQEINLKVQEFECQIQKLRVENQKQKEQIVSLNSQQEQQKIQIQNLNCEKIDLQQQIEKLNQQSSSDDVIEAIKSENQNQKEQIQKQIQREQQQSSEILELNIQKKRLDDLVEEKMHQLEKNKQDFFTEKQVLESEIITLKSSNKVQEEQLSRLEGNFRGEKQRLLDLLAECQKLNFKFKTQVWDLEQKLAKLTKEQNEKEQQKLQKLKSGFQCQMTQIKFVNYQLEQEIGQQKNEISNLNEKLKQTQLLFNQEISKFQNEKNKVEKLEKQIVERDNQIESLKNQNNKMKSLVKVQQLYEYEIQAAQNKIDQEHQQFLKAQEKVICPQKQIDELRKKVNVSEIQNQQNIEQVIQDQSQKMKLNENILKQL